MRDDPAPERLTYDVWSNIHYGYVGRAHGIPAGILLEAQRKIGTSALSDDWSVLQGILLWESSGGSLSKQGLHNALLRNVEVLRRIDTRWSVQPGFFVKAKQGSS